MIIEKISPLSAGKVVGIVYLLMGFMLAIFFWLAALFFDVAAPQPAGVFDTPMLTEMLALSVIVWPIVYAITGFISAVIFAWLYNLTTRWVSGIHIDARGSEVRR